MMQTEGIVLGHHVSPVGLKVDPTKIEIILKLPIPSNQRDVRIFLGYAEYYRRFIENFSKIVLPLFKLLVKYVEFFGILTANLISKLLKKNFYHPQY
jgi:hypothetical protein